MFDALGTFGYILGWMVLIIVGLAVFLVAFGIAFWLALSGLVWVAQKFMKRKPRGDHVAGEEYEEQS